jgi:hypothetical protein
VKSSETRCPFTNFKLFGASPGQEVSQNLSELNQESGVTYLEIKGQQMGVFNFFIGFDKTDGTSS